MSLRALMYTPSTGIQETDCFIAPSVHMVWPACKNAPLYLLQSPIVHIIYAEKADVEPAKRWFMEHILKSSKAMLAGLPDIEKQLLCNIEQMEEALRPQPEQEPITLWIVPELVAAIINNDMSGLSDGDIQAIEHFSSKYNHIMLSELRSCRWTQCEVTKLVGNCMPVYFDPKLSLTFKALKGAA